SLGKSKTQILQVGISDRDSYSSVGWIPVASEHRRCGAVSLMYVRDHSRSVVAFRREDRRVTKTIQTRALMVNIQCGGTGCRRPIHFMRLPNSSMSGSTPKCFMSESAHPCLGGLGRGFCPSVRNMAAELSFFARGASKSK